MKRSEMIKKVREIVDGVADSSLTEYGAELVLDQLEKAGMMPPRSGSDYINTGDGDEIGIDVYEWERE